MANHVSDPPMSKAACVAPKTALNGAAAKCLRCPATPFLQNEPLLAGLLVDPGNPSQKREASLFAEPNTVLPIHPNAIFRRLAANHSAGMCPRLMYSHPYLAHVDGLRVCERLT